MRPQPLALLSALALLALALPVVFGLLLSAALAAGALPVAGGVSGLSALAEPRLWHAAALSLFSALLSTALALGLALCLGYAVLRSAAGAWLARALPAALALPHAAFAVGFAFLIAPSGWLARLFSPWLSGWQRPPDLATVQDPAALALSLALAVKETPFLLLCLLAALGQLRARESLWLGRSLGHTPWRSWWALIVPRLYSQLRLPVLVVLGFGLSVVDMALILGPAVPGTLAVLATEWLRDADPAHWPRGAAAALCLLALAALAAALWWLAERAVARGWRRWALSGQRCGGDGARALGAVAGALWLAALLGAIGALALWALSWRWRFPDPWPGQFGLRGWRGAGALWEAAGNTLWLGAASAALGVLAAIALLEARPRLSRSGTALLYLPLLLPQLAFLFGAQWLLLALHADGGAAALVWGHALFTFPYAALALAGPWRALDPRYRQLALTLGQSRWRVWWRVELPLRLRPLAHALALSFSVSVAQYLSTLFIGAGRFPTLSTEAVALSAGGDRRVLAATASLQMLLPLVAFALAAALPAWRFRHRRGMRAR